MKDREKRVLVGMSGGIDSSATCIMLQEKGYEVVGVTMRTWDIASVHHPRSGRAELCARSKSTGRKTGYRTPCGRRSRGIQAGDSEVFHR